MWNTDKSSIASSAIFLKEPIEKRRRLTRFYTSLATATFFTKRERGDGGNSRTGYADLSQKSFFQILSIFIERKFSNIPSHI